MSHVREEIWDALRTIVEEQAAGFDSEDLMDADYLVDRAGEMWGEPLLEQIAVQLLAVEAKVAWKERREE